MMAGAWVSGSKEATPPGPSSVMRSMAPAHPPGAGMAKTNDDAPSRCAVSGMSKPIENNVIATALDADSVAGRRGCGSPSARATDLSPASPRPASIRE